MLRPLRPRDAELRELLDRVLLDGVADEGLDGRAGCAGLAVDPDRPGDTVTVRAPHRMTVALTTRQLPAPCL